MTSAVILRKRSDRRISLWRKQGGFFASLRMTMEGVFLYAVLTAKAVPAFAGMTVLLGRDGL